MTVKDDALLAKIQKAVADTGSQRKAAQKLGIPRSTIGDILRRSDEPKSGARVLYIDVETAPIQAYVWSIWNVNVGIDMIERDWHLLSYCAKWGGEDHVYYDDQRKAKDIENDRPLLEQIHTLLNEADIVVAQNGDKFDLPKIRWRFLKQGLPPPKPFKTIDTLKILKRNFGATSNKLAFVSDELLENRKEEHKEFPGFKLWKECMAGNKRAWEEMRTYNIMDVIALEELYLKLRPWVPNHLNVAIYGDHSERSCSRCGSHSLQMVGTVPTNVNVYALYKCNDCGGHSRGRQTMVTTATRRTLLAAA